MMVVGLTGGIGSGKTTVAKLFEELGVPLYIADVEAKKLMTESKTLQQDIVDLFGTEAYENGQLNRPFLASKMFKNESLLKKMNALVHPMVNKHFKTWCKRQTAPYVLKEAAIIFENNLQSQYDYIIIVVADKKDKIKRLKRSRQLTEEKIIAIMASQLDDKIKIDLADFVIENTTLESLPPQVHKIHKNLLELARKCDV